MKTERFNDIVEEQIKRSTDVLVNKAKEYATEDRLHNFKVAASLQGVSPIQALAGMMAKHTVSVYDMCMSKEEYSINLWNEKITDHINYLLLLRALIVDGRTSDGIFNGYGEKVGALKEPEMPSKKMHVQLFQKSPPFKDWLKKRKETIKAAEDCYKPGLRADMHFFDENADAGLHGIIHCEDMFTPIFQKSPPSENRPTVTISSEGFKDINEACQKASKA